MPSTRELLGKICQHAENALTPSEVPKYLEALIGWREENNHIVKNFKFLNYYEAVAFLNAAAYIIHAEDHHPEITLSYNCCLFKFNTHSVNGGRGGLSENDFICAAKIDALFLRSFG